MSSWASVVSGDSPFRSVIPAVLRRPKCILLYTLFILHCSSFIYSYFSISGSPGSPLLIICFYLYLMVQTLCGAPFGALFIALLMWPVQAYFGICCGSGTRMCAHFSRSMYLGGRWYLYVPLLSLVCPSR